MLKINNAFVDKFVSLIKQGSVTYAVEEFVKDLSPEDAVQLYLNLEMFLKSVESRLVEENYTDLAIRLAESVGELRDALKEKVAKYRDFLNKYRTELKKLKETVDAVKDVLNASPPCSLVKKTERNMVLYCLVLPIVLLALAMVVIEITKDVALLWTLALPAVSFLLGMYLHACTLQRSFLKYYGPAIQKLSDVLKRVYGSDEKLRKVLSIKSLMLKDVECVLEELKFIICTLRTELHEDITRLDITCLAV